MANDALDSVRKSVQKDLDGKLRRLFKKSRRLLMKREDDLTVDEHAQVQRMLNFSEKLSAAYGMKERRFAGRKRFFMGLQWSATMASQKAATIRLRY